jgi:hypothetical protein
MSEILLKESSQDIEQQMVFLIDNQQIVGQQFVSRQTIEKNTNAYQSVIVMIGLVLMLLGFLVVTNILFSE